MTISRSSIPQLDQPPTVSEALNGLSGVEYENACRMSPAGKTIVDYLGENPVGALFVLVTVLKLRTDKNTMLNKVKADYTVKSIQDFFSPEPDEVIPDEPETEVGKD